MCVTATWSVKYLLLRMTEAPSAVGRAGTRVTASARCSGLRARACTPLHARGWAQRGELFRGDFGRDFPHETEGSEEEKREGKMERKRERKRERERERGKGEGRAGRRSGDSSMCGALSRARE